MTFPELKAIAQRSIRELTQALDAYEASLPAPAILVPSGGNLAGALEQGGAITLEPGGTYEAQGFIIRRPTVLKGQAAILRGTAYPALTIAPGTADVVLDEFAGSSDADNVFQFGENDTGQVRIEDVPRRITASRLWVPLHRDKRAFAIFCANSTFSQLDVGDVYDASPSHADSQSVWIHNTPGNLTFTECSLSGGSEIVLVGGDLPRIPNINPSDLTFERCKFTRPLAWKTDGQPRKVKNIFELKTGRTVNVLNCELDGVWSGAGQQAFAFVFTPRQGGAIAAVQVQDCRVRNCGGLVNILGENDTLTQPPTPFKTDLILFRRGSCVISKAQFGGYGTMALCQRGVQGLWFDNYVCVSDGNKVIDIADKVPHGTLALRDSYFTAGLYSISIAGHHNLTPPIMADPAHPELGGVTALDLRNLTFADAPAALKKNLPAATYLTRAAFEQLPQVQAVLGS